MSIMNKSVNFKNVEGDELDLINGGTGNFLFSGSNGSFNAGYALNCGANTTFCISGNFSGSYTGNWGSGFSAYTGSGSIATVNCGPIMGSLNSISVGVSISF